MKTITNITGFVTAVREAMERRLPDYEVREISVTKMNDLTLEGLTARLKGGDRRSHSISEQSVRGTH